MAAFGSVPIAPSTVLDRMRIDLPFEQLPVAPATVRVLPYVTYFQRRKWWCWAAVAVSVARFYDRSSHVTQCQVAGRVLDRRECCALGPDIGPCDVQVSLSRALEAVGCFGESREPEPDHVCRLIDDGHPVGIFIRWRGGGGHFAAIIGYARSSSGLEFVVADPNYGDRPVLDSALRGGLYRGVGTWARSYTTHPRR